jgi:hypothetical protein
MNQRISDVYGKRRPTIASVALICVLDGWFAAAQEVAEETAAPEDHRPVVAGGASLAGGRRVPIRFYRAPDGTKGHKKEFVITRADGLNC